MVHKIKSRPLFFRGSFENTKVLQDLTRIFIKNRGYAFTPPKVGEAVLLVVSGGLDSIMLWFHLLHKYRLIVYPVYYRGHLMSKNFVPGEQLAVQFFYRYFQTLFPNQVRPVRTIPLDLELNLTNNKSGFLTMHNWKIALSNARITSTKSTNVYLLDNPTRFSWYLLSAYEYGLSLQTKGISIHRLFFGVVPNDSQISRESTRATLRSLNLYFCLLLGDWSWQITGPVEKESGFYFSKEDSIKVGTRYNIPLEKTWSCARKLPIHCGFCNTCRLRQVSFYNAQIVDKTTYLISPFIRSQLGVLVRKMRDFISNKYHVRRRVSYPSRTKYLITKTTVVYMPKYVETFKTTEAFFVRNEKTEKVATINKWGEFIVKQLENSSRLTVGSVSSRLLKKYNKHITEKNSQEIISFITTMVKEGFLKIN